MIGNMDAQILSYSFSPRDNGTVYSFESSKGSTPIELKRKEDSESPESNSIAKLTDTIANKHLSWIKLNHISKILAEQIIGRDYRAAQYSLHLLPLQFRNPQEEAEYIAAIAPVSIARMHQVFICMCIFLGSLWIILTLSIHSNIYSVSSSKLYIPFHSAMGCTFIYAVVGTYLSTNLQYNFSIELAYYIGIPLIYVFPNVWVFCNALLLPGKNSLDAPEIQQINLWTIIFTLGLPLICFIVLSVISRSRTRLTILSDVIYLTLICVLYCIVAYKYAVLEREVHPDWKAHQLFYLSLSILICSSLWISFFMCYFGRWVYELQERVEFWKYSNSRLQLQALRIAKADIRRKGLTPVEEVLSRIVKANYAVFQADTEAHNALLSESTNLLRKVEALLTTSVDLCAVYTPLKIESQLLNEEPGGMGDDTLEAQFLAIYSMNKDIRTDDGLEKVSTSSKQATAPRQYGTCIVSLAEAPEATADFRRAIGRDWNLNILEASKKYVNIMVEVGAVLVEGLANVLETTPVQLRNFVYRLQKIYRDNPYHNKEHATMVAHSLSCFLHNMGVVECAIFHRIDYATALLAALGHDAGHPGRNNTFFVANFHRLAILYNDKAVLENYHSALVFKTAQMQSSKIFSNLPIEDRKSIRKKIIDLILATDMCLHFESMSKFRFRRQATDFNYFENAVDLWLLVKLCFKAADLSHAFVEWSQHQIWAEMICEEFYQQGDEEAFLGLSKSNFCDRTLHSDFPKSQRSFLEYVAQPLANLIEDVDKTNYISEHCVRNLISNKYKWEEISKEDVCNPIHDFIRAKTTDSSYCSKIITNFLIPKGYTLVTDPSSLFFNELSAVERELFKTSYMYTGNANTLDEVKSGIANKNESEQQDNYKKHTFNYEQGSRKLYQDSHIQHQIYQKQSENILNRNQFKQRKLDSIDDDNDIALESKYFNLILDDSHTQNKLIDENYNNKDDVAGSNVIKSPNTDTKSSNTAKHKSEFFSLESKYSGF